ncbi:YheC/D-like protein [Melghirimyces profundicolus]|uniref:YheC/D-like protein n=1 Tax=Melghirimyces profundicolus TaxID=1242148 RepID=A0A2T6BQL9_9BACL|nr:YheC/YheD family protein [Melghirimyces profundicolus]PTX58332.1 YheC/D-like protein [Melghirimyces profundicolus]
MSHTGNVRNKLKIARLLQTHPATALHHPATVEFTPQHLNTRLRRFPLIYLKPVAGCESKGIFRVARSGNRFYLNSGGKTVLVFRKKGELIRHLQKRTAGRRYMIQQGILSETPNGTHFDIRMHLIRLGGRWVVGGTAARVASPGAVVAGLSRGGRAKPLAFLLNRLLGMNPKTARLVRNRLEAAGIRAAGVIGACFPEKKELAVDLGMDPQKKPWIFEVNHVRPSLNVFRKADPAAYRRILLLRGKTKKGSRPVGVPGSTKKKS